MKPSRVKTTNDKIVEWPDVMHAPDYSLLVANELVDVVPMSPPDGRLLFFPNCEFEFDETFNTEDI